MDNRGRNDTDLERMLSDTGREIEYPPTPDLAARAADRIRQDQRTAQPTPFRQRLAPLRRGWAVAALLTVVILATAIAAIPPARSTVADWFGVRGIILVERTATPAPAAGADLNLGERVTFDEVRDRVAYDLQVPDIPNRSGPDEVYLDDYPKGGQVAMIYRAGDVLPRTAETGVGLLFTQFRGDLNQAAFGKGIGPNTTLERVTVDDARGIWIAGDAHVFFYTDETGTARSEQIRLAGNTLLWQSGDLTLRIESALSRDNAIRIAETIAPAN